MLTSTFVGAYELRKDLPALLSQLQASDEEMVVTRKGKPEAMLVPVKKYLDLKMLVEELEEAVRELADERYIRGLVKGKEEIKAGKGKSAKQVFKEVGV